jgi:hypothetical protein
MACELRKPDVPSLLEGEKVILPPGGVATGYVDLEAPNPPWSCLTISPSQQLTKIYCTMSEENGPLGKCSANLSEEREGDLHLWALKCEIGEATYGWDNEIRKGPNGLDRVCFFWHEREQRENEGISNFWRYHWI